MIDTGVLITGMVGVITTIVSAGTSWFFARKKYNAEVNSNEIANMMDSLNFYKNMVEDNNKRLQIYIAQVKRNRVEVYKLRGIVQRLLNNSCLDGACTQRKFLSDNEIEDILNGMNSDETNIKEESI